MDSDHFARHSGSGRLSVVDRLGVAADLEHADLPRIRRHEVVDHERDLVVLLDVPVLARRAHAEAADVDGSVVTYEVPNGVVLGRAVGSDRGKTPESLRRQVLEFGWRERHDQTSNPRRARTPAVQEIFRGSPSR